MINEDQLFAELEAADKAGDTEHARKVAQKIEQQRTAWSKQHGFPDNSIVNKYGLDAAEKQRLELGGDYNPAENMSGERKFATAMGRGFQDVIQGVNQLVRERYDQGAGTDTAGEYTRSKMGELQAYEKLADDSPYIAGAGRLVGNAAAMPLPGAQGGTALTRMGTAGLMNAAAAGTEFVPEGQSRAQNMTLGGVMGTGLQGVVGEPLRALSNKAINAKAGNLNLSDEMNDAVKFADANNLPLYYDDIKMNGIAQKVGQQIDEVPIIGGAKSREMQNQAAKDAAKNLVDKFAPDTQMDDLYGEVSKSAQRQLDRVKEIANKKYDVAYKGLNEAGEIDLPDMRQNIGKLIQEETAQGSLADARLIKQLEAIQNAPSGNFEQWAQKRSRILGLVRDAEKGQNQNVGDNATRVLKQAAEAITNGLDNAAESIGGNSGTRWKNANKFYRETVADYKKGVLANAVKNENPEQILNVLIGRGAGKGTDSTYVTQKLFKGLDKKGKDTVKYALLEKSYSEAIQENGVFSPARFASNLEKFKARTGVLFDKENKAYIDGLTKYMRLAQNSGDFATNIKTGQKGITTAYALAAGAGGVVNAPATLASGAGVKGIERLFRTKRGRSLLLALSSTTEDSKKAADLITQINSYVSRGAALANAQPDTQSTDN